jgi:hypothetical protein
VSSNQCRSAFSAGPGTALATPPVQSNPAHYPETNPQQGNPASDPGTIPQQGNTAPNPGSNPQKGKPGMSQPTSLPTAPGQGYSAPSNTQLIQQTNPSQQGIQPASNPSSTGQDNAAGGHSQDHSRVRQVLLVKEILHQ